MFELLEPQRAVINGLILSLVLGVMVIGSMIYNTRLWLQDYPKPIQDKVPPLSPTEKRGRIILGIVFIGVLLGGTLLEALRLRAVDGLSFVAAYLDIFIFLSIFNLFDALVLDLLVLTLMKPKFAIPAGAEGMEYLFADYHKQAIDFLKGVAFCVVGSLPFAVIAVI